MRLIDADALMTLVKGHGCDKCPSGALQCTFCTLNQFIAMIDSAPTVDAAPVRRGEWLEVNPKLKGVYQCSACGTYIGMTTKALTEKRKDYYCSECGADMRGEEHHESED